MSLAALFLVVIRLEKLLAGAKDGSEFDAWQQKKLGEDRRRKETDSERKRVEGKLSREEAIIARQRRAKENQQKVCLRTIVSKWHSVMFKSILCLNRDI